MPARCRALFRRRSARARTAITPETPPPPLDLFAATAKSSTSSYSDTTVSMSVRSNVRTRNNLKRFPSAFKTKRRLRCSLITARWFDRVVVVAVAAAVVVVVVARDVSSRSRRGAPVDRSESASSSSSSSSSSVAAGAAAASSSSSSVPRIMTRNALSFKSTSAHVRRNRTHVVRNTAAM
eukprot:30961-Pelagococcus_subviridis.AAC.5